MLLVVVYLGMLGRAKDSVDLGGSLKPGFPVAIIYPFVDTYAVSM